MQKLKMQTINKVSENVERIAALFPNCVTESIGVDGKPIKVVDFDSLKAELSSFAVEGQEERYQFTWADKKKSILLANSPISKTLRPCREESVDFDTTKNLYIEGDNLDVLKLLQETYMGKVKMIYIDPPYNTGNDFVYKDDFAISVEEYFERSGANDEDGNRLFQNNDSNGRFHTDWLNMIYPRLKLARDLLTDDGVIFISIDYNENFNLRLMMNEIFGAVNFVGEIYWESKTKSQNTSTAYNKLQPKAEMILVYTKLNKRRFNLISKGNKDYPYSDEQGQYREYLLEVMNASGIRGRESMIYDVTDGVSTVSPPAGKQWKLGQAQVATYRKEGNLFIRDGKVIIKMRPDFERGETTEPFWGFFAKELGTAESAKKELTEILGQHGFETVKPVDMIKRLSLHATDDEDLVLDFFSGSATTAHAVMQLNAEDGGNRKFIMVQLPEETDENSEAYKAGYKNICEIGKERIRRAGQNILDLRQRTQQLTFENAEVVKKTTEVKLMQNELEKALELFLNLVAGEAKEKQRIIVKSLAEKLKIDANNLLIKGKNLGANAAITMAFAMGERDIDVGFRVLKVDTSNMKSVFYNPDAVSQDLISKFEDNIKEDRTPEDLLFQVMLDMGVDLSSPITVETLGGKKVFTVGGDNLICCFDKDITKDAVTEIAKRKPLYAVFRDASFSRDDVMVSFDQIFETFSPTTTRRVI